MLESRCSCLRFLPAMQQLYSNHHRVERCAPRTCTPYSGSETRRYRECRWKRHRGMCRRLRLQDQGRAALSARACCPTRACLPRAHCHYPFRMLHRSGRSAHLQQIHEKVRQEPGTEDTHKQHFPAGPAAIVAQGIPGHVNMPPEHVVRVPPCVRQGGVLRAPCFLGPCAPSRACRSRIPRARLSTEACCLEFLIRLSTALWHACLRLSI